MNLICKKNLLGFTLLEGMLATFIYTAVLAAAMGVMARGIRSTADFQYENIAYLLAAEGVEAIQAIRGDNYIDHAIDDIDASTVAGSPGFYSPVNNNDHLQPAAGGDDLCVPTGSYVGCIIDVSPDVYLDSSAPYFRIAQVSGWVDGQLYLSPPSSGVSPDELSNYTHNSGGGSVTPFQRIITAVPSNSLDGGVLVTSLVRWQSGSIYKTVKTQKYFKNWY